MPDLTDRFITLGWQVTPNLDPRYWTSTEEARPGAQSVGDLVRVPAGSISNHTAIIAQSGSGKSFLLGRLIEEILLETRSRCVVIDPNSDFRKAWEVQGKELWTKAKYDGKTRSGRLPHERKREDFSRQWSQVSVRVRVGANNRGPKMERLRLWWPSLSVEFLAEELDPMLRSDLYHIHAFVKALEPLAILKTAEGKSVDLIEEAERLFRQGRQRSEADFRADLEREFDARQLQMRLRQMERLLGPERVHQLPLRFLRPMWLRRLRSGSKIDTQGLERVPKYVSEVVERFYFGKAREYQAAGILQNQPDMVGFSLKSRPGMRFPVRSRRLEIIDLPSLRDTNTRLLAANTIIAEEWDRARAMWSYALESPSEQDIRVPTFVVVDEAHNLIPASPRSKAEAALREQFRTIVAEGRKYGLFLVLVSQRPDKLDPLVLSECENKIVMKLGSTSVLNITKQLLGLEDAPSRLLEKCLEFEKGRGILIGEWSKEGPQLFYCAARRTAEGGRDLRWRHWAQPDALIVSGSARSARAKPHRAERKKSRKTGKR